MNYPILKKEKQILSQFLIGYANEIRLLNVTNALTYFSTENCSRMNFGHNYFTYIENKTTLEFDIKEIDMLKVNGNVMTLYSTTIDYVIDIHFKSIVDLTYVLEKLEF